jgi:FKBP-type peptidyl-prolyl cis-trans isomerase FkpA
MVRTLAVAAAVISSLAIAAEPGSPPPANQSMSSSPPPGHPGMPPPGGKPTLQMPPPQMQPPPTGEELNKSLYALGLSLGKNVHDFALTKDELKQVLAGFTDEVNNSPNKKVKFEDYMPKVQALYRARREDMAKQALAKGEEFLTKAAKEPGAEKTASGLVIKMLTPGSGASPAPTDTVSVNYKGTLIDGTEFDSSYKRGQPTEFPLNGVIPCWTEGVGKMKVGGKAKLTCPAKIAYGERGQPPMIPGNSTLIFEVELLNIKPKAAAPAPGQTPMPGGH